MYSGMGVPLVCLVYLFDVVCLSCRMSLTTRCSGGSTSSILVTAAPSSTPQVGGCVVWCVGMCGCMVVGCGVFAGQCP